MRRCNGTCVLDSLMLVPGGAAAISLSLCACTPSSGPWRPPKRVRSVEFTVQVHLSISLETPRHGRPCFSLSQFHCPPLQATGCRERSGITSNRALRKRERDRKRASASETKPCSSLAIIYFCFMAPYRFNAYLADLAASMGRCRGNDRERERERGSSRAK